VTANITVPTKTSELTNDSKYVNEKYVEDMALTNLEIEEILNNFN